MNTLFNCNPELFLDSLPGCPLHIHFTGWLYHGDQTNVGNREV